MVIIDIDINPIPERDEGKHRRQKKGKNLALFERFEKYKG